MSLIHLDESTKEFILPSGQTILYEEGMIRRRVMSADREVKQRYKSMKKQDNFCPVSFMIENSLPLDKINGIFPVIFDNYRLVSHSLRMAWAFLLTMKMKKVDRFSFPQRLKNKTFRPKRKNIFSALFIHIFASLSELCPGRDEKKYIKCLKNSLCLHVSEELDQKELPEGSSFNLVPPHFRSHFKKFGKQERIEFFFSLLQSKCLCKEVPEAFILDTLIKHRSQLSTPSKPLSKETLDTLTERGRQFGKLVKKFYFPTQGYLPTNKATFHFPRKLGGVKGDLVHGNVLKNQKQLSQTSRLEPLVIGLFGQPGMGKSSRIPEILHHLSKLFPGVKRSELTYSRTCNVDHWDGYKGQPITILDDIGQSLEGKDIKEFQTLVSCNPYVLPMADLSDKGERFTSPIIIATSNLQYGQTLTSIYKDSNGILDDASFWRRFHIPLYVEDNQLYRLKEEPLWIRPSNLLMRPGLTRDPSRSTTFDFSRLYYQRKALFQGPPTDSRHLSSYLQDNWSRCESDFLPKICGVFENRKRYHANIDSTWQQTIGTHVDDPSSLISQGYYEEQIAPHLPKSLGFDANPQGDSNSYFLEFDAFPQSEPLPVRVEPILEPLKVRTITAGIGQTFCLKPLQRAMWLALGEEEQFCLTHGTNNLYSAIERIYEKSDPNDVWISGDYTAATDSIPIEASKALMDGILEFIDHEPTKRWALKELSPHVLVYPEKTGLEPVLQESGQLMGSLLSFPLLCLLNDCTARSLGLDPQKYLINGDDILMRAPAELYPQWKENVQEFGLSLSLGKNYIHSRYGTVNSQLICEGSVLSTGKQKVLDRRSQVLGECLRDLEYMMEGTGAPDVHHLFKIVNRKKLARTVRSISVPASHGGLSLSWGSRMGLTEKTVKTELLVYLNDLFTKIEPLDGCISIPYLSKQKFKQDSLKKMDLAFNEPVLSEEYHEDFIGIPSLERVRKRLSQNQHLRNLFLNQSLEDLPSLSFLDTIQVPFSDVKLKKEIQLEVFQVFFRNFLNPNTEYNYELFYNSFMDAVKGTKLASVTAVEYLVPIVELQVRPDYLLKVLTGYKAKSFDLDVFTKGLSTELKPKNFNIPSLRDSTDFSLEVTESFDEIQRTVCGVSKTWNTILETPEIVNRLKDFDVLGSLEEVNFGFTQFNLPEFLGKKNSPD